MKILWKLAIPDLNKPTTSRKNSRRATYQLSARGGNDEKEKYGTRSEAFRLELAIENRPINTHVGAERIRHWVTHPCGPSQQFVATTGATQCAPAPVLKEPGASPQSCDRPPQIMKNYRLLDPPRLGRAVAGRNQRFLNFKPFKRDHLSPSLVTAAATIPAQIAARFSNFQI